MESQGPILNKREQIALALFPHCLGLRVTHAFNTSMRDMTFNLDDHGAAVCRDAFDLADAFLWTSEATDAKASG